MPQCQALKLKVTNVDNQYTKDVYTCGSDMTSMGTLGSYTLYACDECTAVAQELT